MADFWDIFFPIVLLFVAIGAIYVFCIPSPISLFFAFLFISTAISIKAAEGCAFWQKKISMAQVKHNVSLITLL